jgi:hypothetical protein
LPSLALPCLPCPAWYLPSLGEPVAYLG